MTEPIDPGKMPVVTLVIHFDGRKGTVQPTVLGDDVPIGIVYAMLDDARNYFMENERAIYQKQLEALKGAAGEKTTEGG